MDLDLTRNEASNKRVAVLVIEMEKMIAEKIAPETQTEKQCTAVYAQKQGERKEQEAEHDRRQREHERNGEASAKEKQQKREASAEDGQRKREASAGETQ